MCSIFCLFVFARARSVSVSVRKKERKTKKEKKERKKERKKNELVVFTTAASAGRGCPAKCYIRVKVALYATLTVICSSLQGVSFKIWDIP